MKANGKTRTIGRTARVATFLLLTALVALPGIATADEASVVVNLSENPSVDATVVDGGLLLHTNTAWTLTVDTADGVETMSGPATGSKGHYVAAEDLVGYTLVAETTR